MKYTSVKVPSHPRSGSHWVMRLLDINFFHAGDYLRHYGGHPFANEPRSLNYFQPKQAVIYTYRTLDAVEKSVFKMRHRFGLDEDDFEKFKVTPMKKMYNRNLKVHAVRNTLTERMDVREVDWLFRDRAETVREYMQLHITGWMNHDGRSNFMRLRYDDLVEDFQGTMLKVACFLGFDKTEFKDEKKRVGWRAKNDNDWKKPGN